MMCADMGEMADMLLDQIDEWEPEDWWESPRRILRCRQCGKRDLNWQNIKGIWTMFEPSGKVHICGGYEPPLEVLKEIAKNVLSKTREDALWRLREKAKKRGGLVKLIPLLPDDQLVDLYACFVRDDQRNYDEPDIGMPLNYAREIAILKGEILKRMLK